MKKTLIALAVLAVSGAAVAQSSVSISGVADMAYQMIDLKGNKIDVVGANGSSTSTFILAGTEDLGGGLKAEFRWEMNPNFGETANRTAGTSAQGTTSNVTSSIGNGSSFVGASGGFGAIKFGAPNIATLSINGDGNSGFATAVGSGYRVSSFDAVRFQNSLRYDSPTMGGFAASVVYSPENKLQANATSTALSGNLNNQTRGRDDVTEIGASYAAGPLTIRAAQLKMKQFADVAATLDPLNGIAWYNTTGAEFKLTSLSASYKLMPTLTVAYFRQDVSSGSLVAAASDGASTPAVMQTTARFDRTTNGLSAAFTATPTTTLRVNYQKASNGANHLAGSSAAGGSSANANKDTTVIGLGADYALSKRTSVYARYERNDDKAGMRAITGYTAATGNTTYTATAVGVRHSF